MLTVANAFTPAANSVHLLLGISTNVTFVATWAIFKLIDIHECRAMS